MVTLCSACLSWQLLGLTVDEKAPPLYPPLSLRKQAVKLHFLRKEAEKAGAASLRTGHLTLGNNGTRQAEDEASPDLLSVHFRTRLHGDSLQ